MSKGQTRTDSKEFKQQIVDLYEYCEQFEPLMRSIEPSIALMSTSIRNRQFLLISFLQFLLNEQIS